MNVAFIPVRGGSKSIPHKNIKLLCGKPLVYWVIQAAYSCKWVDKIYVSTDSEKIRDEVLRLSFDKVEVIGRGPETTTDTASTELAMLEFAQNYAFDTIALIQATSPLLKSSDLDQGFEYYYRENVDSVLSVVRQKRFIWQTREDDFVEAVNYDPTARPRRQDFDGYLVENGAFYITGRERLLQTKNRISGNISAVEMSEDTIVEIDEPSDWCIVESIMKKKCDVSIPDIKMFLTDCDGCLTDGGMYYFENGDEAKKFNTKDGMGFQLLRECGILTGIVTSESTELVCRRAEKLKLDIVKTGIQNKSEIVLKLCEEYGIPPKNVAYVGDDRNDVETLQLVGFACSVVNGAPEAKEAAHYVTQTPGGSGAVREVIDLILNTGFWRDNL